MEQFREFLDSIPNRGIFVARHVTQATISSLLLGVAGGVFASQLLPYSIGPLVPYLTCSCIGFSVSSYHCWRQEKDRALYWARKYPELMKHHLRASFPGYVFRELEMDGKDWVDQLDLAGTTWLILAAQTAAKDVEEIESRKAAAIVDAIGEDFKVE